MLCVLVDAISYFVSDVILNPDCLVSRPAACYSSGHFQNVLQYEQAQRHAARTWVYRRYIRRIKDCGYWRQLRTLAISLRSVTTSRVRFYWIGTLKWNNSSDGGRRGRESVSSLVSSLVHPRSPAVRIPGYVTCSAFSNWTSTSCPGTLITGLAGILHIVVYTYFSFSAR